MTAFLITTLIVMSFAMLHDLTRWGKEQTGKADAVALVLRTCFMAWAGYLLYQQVTA